ncbi:MAG: hypothetical protein KGI98_06290 [Euryarchaeota archaeon]|nr:hypothetical protein [Euryarchaeota archaeon]MDE1879818.1 hypothetical protein [Euryarchaeota archaeon]
MKPAPVLYGLVWTTFLQILIILLPLPSSNIILGVHIALGLAVAALAGTTYRLVRSTGCPKRIRRIAKSTSILASIQVLLGIGEGSTIAFKSSPALQNAVLAIHLVFALAILAHTASQATSFDMWEEREIGAPAVSSSPVKVGTATPS